MAPSLPVLKAKPLSYWLSPCSPLRENQQAIHYHEDPDLPTLPPLTMKAKGCISITISTTGRQENPYAGGRAQTAMSMRALNFAGLSPGPLRKPLCPTLGPVPFGALHWTTTATRILHTHNPSPIIFGSTKTRLSRRQSLGAAIAHNCDIPDEH